MDAVARQVRLHAAGDTLMSGDGAGSIWSILRDYFAPDTVGNVLQGVARLLQIKRTDQTTDMLLAEFHILRRKAESEVQIGGASSGAFVSVLRSPFSWRVPAGSHSFPFAGEQMRRLH